MEGVVQVDNWWGGRGGHGAASRVDSTSKKG